MKNEGIFVGRDMSYLFSFYVLCTYSAVNQYEQRKLKLKHFVHKVTVHVATTILQIHQQC